MLNGLDAIDWGALKHAYGEASDVPDLLRGLLSADPNIREDAIHELFGNIWHQGTVYSASAAAVPFLFELLAADETHEKSTIACLLASIAAGRGYLEVHAVGEFGEPAWRKILRDKGKSLEAELAREYMEVHAVHLSVSPELPHLLPYLCDDDPEVRISVAEALARHPEHIAVSLPALKTALESETSAEVREVIQASLTLLTSLASHY